MTSPFEMIGDEDAPTCVDGVCAIPSPTSEAAATTETPGDPS